MEVKRFITRPDIMSIYNKDGMTEEVLASITEVAGYQIAKEKMDGAATVVNEVLPEEPIEPTQTEEPTVTEVTPDETPIDETPEVEPEIVVEETEE